MAINWQDTHKDSKPEPLQRGFAGEILPTAFSIGGGILGGMAGLAGGPAAPVTVPAGTIGGAATGGALGETIQQSIEKNFGLRDSYDPGQIAATGVINGALEAGGAIFAKLAKPVFEVTKPVFVKTLSKLSGYSDTVLHDALTRTPGAIQGVKNGETALVDIVKKTATGVSDFAKKTIAENKAKIAEFSARSVNGSGGNAVKPMLLDEGTKFMSRTVDSLRSNFNIGVDKAGQLMFDRGRNMSNIVAGGDKSAIQDAFDAIATIGKNPDIKHIDSVLERLITLRTKTPVGSPTGAETRSIISHMSDNVVDFVKSIPKEFGTGYQNYAAHLQETLPKRIMISDAKELFGGSPNLSPKEVSQISKRLLQLYNTGNLEVKNFAKKVGDTIGQDITGTAAGTLIKTGDQQSVRAPNLTTRGVLTKLIEVVPRGVVKNYIATGKITGELNAGLEIASHALGVTKKALITEFANLTANKKTSTDEMQPPTE